MLIVATTPVTARAQTAGNACTATAVATMQASGINLYCHSNVWSYPAYQFGSANGASCASGLAGEVQWTGTALQFCNGSNWISLGGGSNIGPGSTGYDSIWTSPTAIGTGLIYESGGQVGIGTASPLSTFSVYGGAISDTLSIGTTSTNGVVLANLTAATSSVQQFSPRLHFEGQGWKTASTAGSQTVDIIEELQPQSGNANPSGNLVWSSQVNGGGYNPLMTLTTGGNVGIGTTVPLAPLNVAGADGSTLFQLSTLGDAQSYLTVSDTTILMNRSADSNATLRLGTNDDNGWGSAAGGAIQFLPGGNSVSMTILRSGNVGIGTTSPTGKLHIYGPNQSAAAGTPLFRLTDTNINDYIAIDNGSSDFRFITGSSNLEFQTGSHGYQLALSSNGYVGVGTGSPQGNLHIYGSNNGAGVTLDGTQSPGLTFNNNGTNKAFIVLPTSSGSFSADAAANDLVVRTQGTSQKILFTVNGGVSSMMALNNGNVGIGTTSPSQKLEVNGNAQVDGAYLSYGTNGWYYTYLDTPNTTLHLHANNADIALNAVSGNVGIGTANPSFVLNVQGQESTLPIVVKTPAEASASNYTGIGFSTQFDGIPKAAILYPRTGGSWGVGDLVFAVNNNFDGTQVGMSDEKMRITYGGNVGIGTTSPAAKLSFGQQVGVDLIRLYDSTYSYGFGIQANELQEFIPSGAHISFNSGGTLTSSGTSEIMRITGTGNVGIGTTSPASQFTLYNSSGNASALITSPTASSELVVDRSSTSNIARTSFRTNGSWNWSLGMRGSTSNFSIYDEAASAPRVTVDTSGNVGIGTTSPSYPLHVNGNAYFASNILAATNAHLVMNSGEFQINAGAGGDYYRFSVNSGGAGTLNHFRFTNTDSSAYDLNLSRLSAGKLALGNGTLNDYSGTLIVGNVGIGSTSPVNTLDVVGTGIHIGSGVPGATTYQLYNNGGTLMWNGSAVGGGSLSWPLAGSGDSNSAPDYSWSGHTNTGLYYNSGIGFTVGGSSIGSMTSTGLNGMAVGATTASTGAFTTGAFSGAITDTQSIGTSSTNGVVLTNTTAAANNVQQWSPRLHYTGQGWETGTSASQAVDFISELQTTQSSASTATGNLTWSSAVNGGSYSSLMSLTSAGNLGIGTATPGALFTVGNNTFEINSSGDVTAGIWQGTAVGAIYGGTAQTSYATGDMLYASGANTLAKLAAGSANQVLTMSGGVPTWATTSSVDFGSNTDVSPGGTTLNSTHATQPLVVMASATRSSTNCTISGLTDSSNPPTTTVVTNTTASAASSVATITFPVKNGDYYKITTSNCGNITAKTTPLTGSGGGGGGSGTVNSGTQYQMAYYATSTTAVSGESSITTDASNDLFVGGSVGVGTTVASKLLSLTGSAAETIWMERNPTGNTAGNNLTLQASGATSGATNKSGGTLILSGGTSTGSGTGQVQIQVFPGTAGSTSDNTAATAMTINGSSNVGIQTTSPDAILSLTGQSAETIDMVRETTGNTAGNGLTVQAGGATSGATNKAGGNLVLSSGTSTGSGTSQVQFKVFPGTAGSTSDNTAATAMTINGSSNVGIQTTSPDAILSLTGQSAETIDMVRETTGNTAGNNLTVQAGGATSGATNKSGGTLILSGGTSTGSGTGQIQFKTFPGTAGSTSDNTAATAMTIDGSGNVGIGATSPSGKLTVQSDNTTTGGIKIQTSSTSQWTNLHFAESGGAGRLAIQKEANNDMTFYTGTGSAGSETWSERMRMTTGGNVGIGTTAPATTLDVNGSVGTRGSADVHYYDVFNYYIGGSVQTGTLKIMLPTAVYRSGTLAHIVIRGYDYSGVGAWEVVVGGQFGTSGAGGTGVLNISATIKGRAPFDTVRLAEDGTHDVILLGTTSTNWGYDTVEVSDVITSFLFENGYGWGTGWSAALLTSEAGIVNSSTATIDMYDSNGNIGIGTTLPHTKLDITTNGANTFSDMSHATNFQLYIHDNAAATGNGNGIAFSNTGEPDDVGGAIVFKRTNSSSQGELEFWTKQNTGTNGPPSEVMVLSDSGNVGIATSAPAYQLEVNGSANGTGALRVIGNNSIDPALTVENNGNGGLHFTNSISSDTNHNEWYIFPSDGDRGIGDYKLAISPTDSSTDSILVIDRSGKVGIGATSPGSLLHLQNDASASIGPILRLFNAAGGAGAGGAIDFSGYSPSSQPTENRIASYDDGNYGGNLAFLYKPHGSGSSGALSEGMRLTSYGNVGIGTPTPHFSGENEGRVLSMYSATDNYPSTVELIGAVGSADDAGGKVGFFDTYSGNTNEIAKISGLAGETDANYGKLAFYTANNGTFHERMRLDEFGNVGIGSSFPQGTLEVEADTGDYWDGSTLHTSGGLPHPSVVITNSNGGVYDQFLVFHDAYQLTGVIGAQDTSEYGRDMFFLTSNDSGNPTERMRLNRVGQVFIPGNINMGSAGGTGNAINIGNDAGGNGGIYMQDGTPQNTSNALYSSGGVLYWSGSAVAGGGGTGTVSSATQYQLAYYAASNSTVSGNSTIKTDASSNLLITTGSVGIGSSTPANSLDIKASGGIHIGSGIPTNTAAALYNNGGTLTWNGTALSTGGSGTVTSSTAGQVAYYSSTGTTVIGTSTLTVSSGKVGIGSSTPVNLLDLGSGGGLHITSGVPGSTSMALYNNSGTLTWNGNAVATGASLSGTTGYISYFTGSSTVGNSVMYESGSNVAIGTTTASNILSLSGGAAQTIWMERNPTGGTAGNSLTLQASGAAAGGTNLNGGTLILSGGTSTGSGTGTIEFQVFPGTAGSTSDNTAATAMTITGNSNVGIGTTTPAAALEVKGTMFSRRVALSDGATIAVDWSQGNTQSVTLGGNRTFTFSNPVDGARYTLMIKQDSTGSRTMTWPASVRWPGGTAPTLTTTPNKTDYITFIYNGVDSKYDGVGISQNF